MALTPKEQPTRLRGSVEESAINTFTAVEISVPRDISDKLLYDADYIRLNVNRPIRTTIGNCSANVQLQLSDEKPTAMMTLDDSKLVADYFMISQFTLIESAAGVFTLSPTIIAVEGNRDGIVDSARWRNLLHDDKIWLCVKGGSVTNILIAISEILGKLDKVSSDDFNALILSKL